MNNTTCLQRVLLISASPRIKGTSVMLLERIRKQVQGELVHLYLEETETILEKMKAAETIVISGPCYINGYPGALQRLLEVAQEKAPWEGQKLYGIINGGMPYVHTHRSGVDSLKLFSSQCGFSWMGGFVLGGGAMLDGGPLEKHLSAKKVVPAFEQFVKCIAEGQPSPDALYEEAQTPPGKVMTHVFAGLLSFMMSRKLKKYGVVLKKRKPRSKK